MEDESLKRVQVSDKIMKMYEEEGAHESIIAADLRNCLMRVYLAMKFTPHQMTAVLEFMSDHYRACYERMFNGAEIMETES